MTEEKLLFLFSKMRKLLINNGKYEKMTAKVINAIKKSYFFNNNKVISIFSENNCIPLDEILLDNNNYARNTFVYPAISNDNVVYYHIESPKSLILNDNGELIPDNCFTIDINDIDTILIPGEAFDMKYNRLSCNPLIFNKVMNSAQHKVRIGVCFDCQVYRRSLPESNKVDGLLTEEGIYNYIDLGD